MENRVCIFLSVFITIFLIFSLFATVFPKVYEFYADRELILDNNSDLFDVWNSKPLLQQRKFYFYNVTNVDNLNNPGVQVRFDKVGPFVYNVKENDNNNLRNKPAFMNHLSYSDLKFMLRHSVADESSVIYFLNLTHINNDLSSKEIEQKIDFNTKTFKSRLSSLHKWTVKEILRNIIYTQNLSDSQLKLPGINHATDKSYAFNKNIQDKDNKTHDSKAENFSNILDFIRVINATFYNDKLTLDVFEKVPFSCVMFVRNGTELERKTYPKHYDVSTQKFILLWKNDICGKSKNKEVSSAFYKERTYSQEVNFKNKSRIFFDFNLDISNSSLQAYFNIEPVSSIVTSFNLQYKLKIESESIDNGKMSNKSYPFVWIEIYGKSTSQTDAVLYRYIAFPTIFLDNILPKIILFSVCFLVASSAVIYIIIFHDRVNEEDDEATPLLKSNIKTMIGSRLINTYI